MVLTPVAAAVIILSIVLSATSPQPPAATLGLGWHLVSSVNGLQKPFTSIGSGPASSNDIVCPTRSTCYITARVQDTGSTSSSPIFEIYVSHDGGHSWTPTDLPPGLQLDTSLSCPHSNTCLIGAQQSAAGQNSTQLLLKTSDFGTSWSQATVLLAPVTGIDGALDQSIVGQHGFLTQLQCFTAMACVGLGLVPSDQVEGGSDGTGTVERSVFVRTADGGSSWSTYVFPWSANPDGSPGWSNAQVGQFTCATPQMCISLVTVLTAVINNSETMSVLQWRTTNGGTTWQSSWLLGESEIGLIAGIACPDASHCVASEVVTKTQTSGRVEQMISTTDGGSTWKTPVQIANGLPGGPVFVACTRVSDCYAAGGTEPIGEERAPSEAFLYSTTDGGGRWNASHLPAGLQQVGPITCSPANACFALGYGATGGSGTISVLSNRTGANSLRK
jgi:photosystem II stability/assembly factor-like uncharacterized protein